MKISFSNKVKDNNLVLIYCNKSDLFKTVNLNPSEKILLEQIEKINKTKKIFTDSLSFSEGNKLKNIIISKIKLTSKTYEIESLAGRILSQLERKKLKSYNSC